MNDINGIWRPGSGKPFESTSPARGEVLWTGRESTGDDVASAVASARQALAGWKSLSIPERTGFLLRFKEQLVQHQTQLTRLISQEVGKPLWDAATEVQGMIGKVDLTLQAFESRRSPSELSIPGGIARTHYVPLGVIAVFGPFNFPGHIANGQILPALLAGNTVLFKPSELTPLVAQETVKLWEAAGLPAGVLNLLQGGRETGESLSTHPGIQAILFTGSFQTGVALQRALVGRPEVLLALELGGNNPLIVHRPTDLDAAVYWTIQSAFITSGQRCTCARRLIVTAGNERFLKRLTEVVSRLTPGFPDDQPQPFLGPLIHAGAVDRLLDEQQRLVASGAVTLVAARRTSQGTAFVTPGLLDVTGCRNLSDEELFGPLLQVTRVSDLTEAIEAMNRTRYGLASAVFTEAEADFRQVAAATNAGLINWNRPTTGASGQLPFGGRGRSGNHRPAGFQMIDSCNSPVAMMESSSLHLPETLSPGIDLS